MRRLRRRRIVVAAAVVALILAAAWALLDDRSRREGRPLDARAAAVVWAVGDGADGGDDARRLATSIATGRVDRFLYLGDVYENGTAADFANNYEPIYGRFVTVTAPTPGNHEWANRATGYHAYWRRRTGRRPRDYYRLSAGGWTLLSLNSEADHGPRSRQVRWLGRLDLRGTCTLAFWHRPRYSAGRYPDGSDLEPLWNALRGRASIVLTGHDHNMQRFEPRDGITHFVSGAGGKSTYAVADDYPGLAYANDLDFGALRLELRAEEAEYAFVTARGRVLDTGVIPCEP